MSMRIFNSFMMFIGGTVRRLTVLAAVAFFAAGHFLGWWSSPSLINVNVTVPPELAKSFDENLPKPIEPQSDWVKSGDLDPKENEMRHFQKHGAEFPFVDANEYTAVAKSFVTRPPEGTLSVIQKDNDHVFYNPELNFFAVTNKDGQLRTFYRLDPEIHGHQSNMDYFKAQQGR